MITLILKGKPLGKTLGSSALLAYHHSDKIPEKQLKERIVHVESLFQKLQSIVSRHHYFWAEVKQYIITEGHSGVESKSTSQRGRGRYSTYYHTAMIHFLQLGLAYHLPIMSSKYNIIS